MSRTKKPTPKNRPRGEKAKDYSRRAPLPRYKDPKTGRFAKRPVKSAKHPKLSGRDRDAGIEAIARHLQKRGYPVAQYGSQVEFWSGLGWDMDVFTVELVEPVPLPMVLDPFESFRIVLNRAKYRDATYIRGAFLTLDADGDFIPDELDWLTLAATGRHDPGAERLTLRDRDTGQDLFTRAWKQAPYGVEKILTNRGRSRTGRSAKYDRAVAGWLWLEVATRSKGKPRISRERGGPSQFK